MILDTEFLVSIGRDEAEATALAAELDFQGIERSNPSGRPRSGTWTRLMRRHTP